MAAVTVPTPGGAAAERARAAVQEVWGRVRPAVLARVDVLDEAIAALVESRFDEQQRVAAEREAHRIAGSVGTFGYSRASEMARILERFFAAGVPREGQSLRRAGEQVALVRRELSAPPRGSPGPFDPSGPPGPSRAPAIGAAGSPGPSDRSGSPKRSDAPSPGLPAPAVPPGPGDADIRLLVVHADDGLRARVRAAAEARGLSCDDAPDLRSALGVVEEGRPDAALVDLALPRGGALPLLAHLDRAVPRPATLVVVGDGPAGRVEAAGAGARGFLPPWLPPPQLVDAVAETVDSRDRAGARLLAVDDDPALLEALRAIFRSAGLRLATLDDPLRFCDALRESAPDLLLLDLDMPHVDGVELCRRVRSDPRWVALPVLVLTADHDPATVERVFAAGADDFVAKPVVGPELLTRVTNRLERVRLYRTLAETDALTGLANRRRLEVEMARFQALAAEYAQPLSFALLDLDSFKRVNDRYGHAVGDEVLQRLADLLRRTFRAEDVVARWGGEEIAVGMFGMSRADGVRRVDAALEAFRAEEIPAVGGTVLRVTFSAGVAQYALDGTDLHGIYCAADQVLYRAKATGGNRVLPADRCPPG